MKLKITRERGLFGVDSVAWWAIAIGITIAMTLFVINMNYGLARLSWVGFLRLMSPGALYPDLMNLPSYPKHPETGIAGMMSAAIYLNQVITEKIVELLLLFMLYLVGMMYLFADLFEQFLGRLKSIVPRLIMALILAYGSVYVVQFLLMAGKYAYMALYSVNVGKLGLWKEPGFYSLVSGGFVPPQPPQIVGWIPGLKTLESYIMRYLWSFLSVNFSILLLMLVAVRDLALAVLITLLPIGSILLLTPWTSRLGTRLWFLTLDLIMLPFVMIIPLMLTGPVASHISFIIAGLVITAGSIYLISTEPSILSGIGFGKAGEHLSRGIVIGTGLADTFGALAIERGTITGGPLKGGLSQGVGSTATHAITTAHRVTMNSTRGTSGAFAGMFGTGTYMGYRALHHLGEYMRKRKR